MDATPISVDTAALAALAADHAIESERPGLTRIAPNMTLEECVRFCDNFLAAEHMGSFSYFGQGSWVANTDRIGRYCSIGQRVSIGAGPHPTDRLSSSTFFYRRAMWASHPLVGAFYKDHPVEYVFDSPPCTIGNDVWIGHDAVVVRGVRVGDGAVIGANATVTADVPPYAIVGGSPARIIRYRFEEDTIQALLASQWWTFNPLGLKRLDYRDIDACLAAVDVLSREPDALYHPRTVRTQDWVTV